MPERDNEKSKDKLPGEYISIIYNQKNDSPKYFELKKSKILLFVIGLPTITLIALVLGGIGLIHTSPFHLMDTYRQNSLAREAVSKTNALMNIIQTGEEEKAALTKKLAVAEEQLKTAASEGFPESTNNKSSDTKPTTADKCPAAPVCPAGGTVNSIGLSTLSLFKPIQGQRDRTRPATLNLSGFKVVGNRDTTNLQFNIIPAIGGEGKLAGNIIVLMKNELTIQFYPGQALNGGDTQVNYSSGEPFSTQRFRPVDASFLKPRKPGNYTFTVYIFAKNGDLIHYQSVVIPVKF
ncbi:MAG: hypothetical protein H7281_11750 [Bacteriovorax sp.]|nr:hypothetical protein [Bacteriovorax sp.]